jgi:UTP--glucose-1-phosphate uridylyltransferase
VAGAEVEPGLFRCDRLVEKPTLEEAPSRLGITGAYVLTPDIYGAIDRTRPGRGGEVQLTDALQLLARERPVFAATFSGTRYDIGDRYLWLKTNIEFALRSPGLGDRLRSALETMLRESP